MLINNNTVLCRGCGFELGSAGENPKARCITTDFPLRKANPWVALRWQGNSQRFILKEYACPWCGLLIAVDQRLKAEDTSWNDYQVF